MGLIRYAAFLGGVALLGHHLLDMLYSKHPLHFEGDVDSKFEGVRQAFQQNFIDGWEAEGASVAVFVKGKKVVDVWGGYADIQAARTWKKDTMTVVFSTTKAVAAVCVALLADRGRLKYDDLVSKHWPGFAKNGKENITIEWVMSHMAGLHYFDTPITEEMALSHDLMRKVIEDEAPKVAPGRSSGYHAFTYGWLVDQIVRHTDEKKRGIGQFLREEITQPNGIDFHIGLSPSEEYRVARVSLPQLSGLLGEIWHDKRIAQQVYNFWTSDKNSPMVRAISNPSWLNVVTQCTVNNPDQHFMEQAGALGIGNARSLAAIFNLVWFLYMGGVDCK
ncbi:beta-lactamase [Ancylostoma duodenale]|uniref:Beta-lactamase n=1 Tax=Ancylostoma duodenale TaxID=51022 RepID=A0A0C2D1E8_9BILA|nr:beta-lactamase [Ancylostoma duodenale]